jgi:hypothetical protein
MAPVPEIDHQAQIRHFQSINAGNVTNIVNILLTLSVGVTAFGVNILVNTTKPLDHVASIWLIASFVMLFGATLSGIIVLFTRLEDYRATIDGARMMRDNPGAVTDPKLIEKALRVKGRGDRLNRWTNLLLYVFPVFFSTGFFCLCIAVFAIHGSKFS